MTKENQLQLPFEDSEQSHHDYGGKSSSNDKGHEWPFVVADSTEVAEPLKEVPEIPGIAVDLAARAHALMTIMDFYSYNNLLEGMKKQSQNPRSDFRRRYGKKSEDVVRGAIEKRNSKLADYHQAMKVIYPKDEITEAIKAGELEGFEEFDADSGYTGFKNLINNIYSSPGPDERAWRRELVNGVRTSTQAITRAELPEPTIYDESGEEVSVSDIQHEPEGATAPLSDEEKKLIIIRASGEWQDALDRGDVESAAKLWTVMQELREELGYDQDDALTKE